MTSMIYTTPWAILREAWPRVEALIKLGLATPERREERKDPTVTLHSSAPLGTTEARVPKVPKAKGAVAVVPIRGVLVQHREDTWYGDTTTDWIGQAIDELESAQNVGAIVLDVDSPGGIVFGVQEVADKIRSYRGAKPIYSVANGMAASAAYWIASASEKFYATPSGQVGSIGIWQPHVDISKWEEAQGLKTTLIFAGKYKVEGHPFAPLDDEARATMQAEVDAYYDRFLAGVAANRGVTPSQVRKGYGEGRLVLSEPAKSERMVDGIATLDELLAGILRPKEPIAKSSNRNLVLADILLCEAGVPRAFTHNSTTADNEPDWGSVDKTKLPRIAFADEGEPDKKSTWRYPHHWVQNGGGEDENGVYTTGTLYLHVGGLNAAWSAANGGRSGQEASNAVKSHLQAHRRALGIEDE